MRVLNSPGRNCKHMTVSLQTRHALDWHLLHLMCSPLHTPTGSASGTHDSITKCTPTRHRWVSRKQRSQHLWLMNPSNQLTVSTSRWKTGSACLQIDTPTDTPARDRFARYRGLKSWRSSPWDAREGLPQEYANTFAFENFKRAHKR